MNLDEFKKLTIKIANIDEAISDENLTDIILKSLPDSYRGVKTVIKY